MPNMPIAPELGCGVHVQDISGQKNLEEELFYKPQKEGIKTPWENVNRHIVSFEPGDLITLSS